MPSKMEAIGAKVPAPQPPPPAPVPETASARVETSGTTIYTFAPRFETLVIEKLEQILRKQKDLTREMVVVKEKVASLEKKLAIVEITLDEPAPESQAARAPQL